MPVVYTGMHKGERFNSISHLIGAALALAGGVVLVTYAAMDGDMRRLRLCRRGLFDRAVIIPEMSEPLAR